jgi:hypothetical protein
VQIVRGKSSIYSKRTISYKSADGTLVDELEEVTDTDEEEFQEKVQ